MYDCDTLFIIRIATTIKIRKITPNDFHSNLPQNFKNLNVFLLLFMVGGGLAAGVFGVGPQSLTGHLQGHWSANVYISRHWIHTVQYRTVFSCFLLSPNYRKPRTVVFPIQSLRQNQNLVHQLQIGFIFGGQVGGAGYNL
jgi:hypothetical protein